MAKNPYPSGTTRYAAWRAGYDGREIVVQIDDPIEHMLLQSVLRSGMDARRADDELKAQRYDYLLAHAEFIELKTMAIVPGEGWSLADRTEFINKLIDEERAKCP